MRKNKFFKHEEIDDILEDIKYKARCGHDKTFFYRIWNNEKMYVVFSGRADKMFFFTGKFNKDSVLQFYDEIDRDHYNKIGPEIPMKVHIGMVLDRGGEIQAGRWEKVIEFLINMDKETLDTYNVFYSLKEPE